MVFANVPRGSYYIFTAYDASGTWDGTPTPEGPPSGTSLGVYTTKPPKPEPIQVDPGKATKIKVTFDDTRKVP